MPNPVPNPANDTETTPVKVTAIVLAAGQSQRMGQPKQLLSLTGSTVLSLLISTLCASLVDEIIVVLAKEVTRRGEMMKICNDFPVQVVVNDNPTSDMADSLRVGVTVSKVSTPQGILVSLCGQPLVGVSVVNALVSMFVERPDSICLPTYKTRRGHPIVLPYLYVKNIDKTETLSDIMQRNAESIIEIPVDTPAILDKLDTPGDYEALRQKLA